jgi:hypothetical protein
VQHALLPHVLAQAMPFERALAADMQACDLAFQEKQARVERQYLAGPAIHATRQALEPPRARVVDRQVSGDTQLGELRGAYRRPGG